MCRIRPTSARNSQKISIIPFILFLDNRKRFFFLNALLHLLHRSLNNHSIMLLVAKMKLEFARMQRIFFSNLMHLPFQILVIRFFFKLETSHILKHSQKLNRTSFKQHLQSYVSLGLKGLVPLPVLVLVLAAVPRQAACAEHHCGVHEAFQIVPARESGPHMCVDGCKGGASHSGALCLKGDMVVINKKLLRNPVVHQVYHVAGTDQELLRLDIAVDVAPAVHVLDTGEALQQGCSDSIHAETLHGLEDGTQVLPQQLEDHVGGGAGLAAVVELGDTLAALEITQDLGLLQDGTLGADILLQSLVGVLVLVVYFKDLTIATLAYFIFDSVSSV